MSDIDKDIITNTAIDWCMRINETELSQQELLNFEQWLNEDIQHRNEYNKANKIWQLSSKLSPNFSSLPKGNSSINLSKKSNQASWIPLAQAACIILMILPLFAYLGWLSNIIPNSYETYSTKQQKKAFTLPDGSDIELNLNTKISYANYRDRRQIKLAHGEVYFDVAHDKNKPFIVFASTGKITVTGTRFNVWEYQGNVKVTVTHGSVSVANDDSQISVTPGLQASFSQLAPVPSKKKIQVDKALSWREGLLILDDLSLGEALPLINRYLNDTQLVFESAKLAKLRIGGIYRTKNIENMVTTLPEILPVRLDKQPNGNIKLLDTKVN